MGGDHNKIKHKYPTRGKKQEEEYHKGESSDSDDEEWETEDEEEALQSVEEMDKKEFRKLLSKLFPSKYIKEKTKNTQSTKNSEEQSCENKHNSPKKEVKRSSDIKIKGNKIKSEVMTKSTKNKKEKTKKKNITKDDSSDSESDEDDYEEQIQKEAQKFNIIFTLGGLPKNADYSSDEEYSTDEDYYDEDDEDNEYSESEEEEEDIDESEEEETTEEETSKENKSKKSSEEKSSKKESITDEEVFDKVRLMINELSEKDSKNKLVQSMIKDFETKEKEHKKCLKKKTKKQRNKNANKFRGLLREKNVLNDLKFFRDKLSIEEQKTILTEMEEVKKLCEIERPYRLTLLNADIPTHFKALAYRKIDTLKYMDPGSGEYFKIKNWVDTFMQIPFGKYKNLPLSIDDGVEASHNFMENAKATLDEAVFGLNDAKLQIMQMVGQWITNPSAVGSAIAIKGPMGTGKTTLVKEGISKILQRDFAFIALGGATDSSFLEGHSYTYEGSTWGKIVDIIIQCKCMNPVIYFDELDKVSDTPKGEEIIGILTHLTDTSQNSKFHDKYFSELDFDLSRCLFIFSYNDESKVNPILRDRMYRIQTKGYDQTEKTTIAQSYLMKTIQSQVKFKPEDITIPDNIIKYIIEQHTEKEDGVRNLKRCLEIIHTKLNLYRLMRPGSNLFEKDMSLDVKFPMEVTEDVVDKLIKQEKKTGSWQNMYL